MPRPTTKPDLMSAANGQFEKMWKLIDSMPKTTREAAFNFSEAVLGKEAHWNRDENLRDVLVHLYEWHQLLLRWVSSNQSGTPATFIPAPYNWKSYGDMNVEFWRKHQQTPLEDSLQMLQESHANVMTMIEGLSNEELFAKGGLPWTGTSTLGSYCVSATASHYDWAMKKIKAHIKTQKG